MTIMPDPTVEGKIMISLDSAINEIEQMRAMRIN